MNPQREYDTFTLEMRPRQFVEARKKVKLRQTARTHLSPIFEDDGTDMREGVDEIMKNTVEVQSVEYGLVMEDEGSGMFEGPAEEDSSDKENNRPEVDKLNSDDKGLEEGEVREDGEIRKDGPQIVNWTTEGFFLVAEDFSKVFDPKRKSMIPMPASQEGKREALLNIFLWFSKLSYFATHWINIVPLFDKVPKGFWDSLFTSEETAMLVKEQEKNLLEDILARLTTVIVEWQETGCYPVAPELRTEVELAKTKDQRARRRAYFTTLLLTKTTETDAWIMHVFGGFRGVVAFNMWLDSKSVFREMLVESIALLAEVHFVEITIRQAEIKLAFSESIESMIGSIIRFNVAYFP